MDKIKYYAITGGIGSGKSVVTEFISELGYKTISCDNEIKHLYEDAEVIKKLSAMFPTAVIKGVIDKKIISEIVFHNEQKLKELNALLHPLVIDRCFNLAKENNAKGVAFIEVPLLFESSLEKLFDGVIVVVRNIKNRIESVQSRSNLTEKEILDRIRCQIDYDKKDLSKYVVIENFGGIDELKQKILEKIKKIIS